MKFPCLLLFGASARITLSEFCQVFYWRQLQWCSYQLVRKFDNMFSHSHMAQECDEQTDRQTDMVTKAFTQICYVMVALGTC